jgi:hypothetical protein
MLFPNLAIDEHTATARLKFGTSPIVLVVKCKFKQQMKMASLLICGHAAGESLKR